MLLCKADVLSLTGEPERALRAYWRVFVSPAGVELKMTSLYQIASTEYRLKRYDAAAEHFRMYGMYYPRSEEASRALDTAARIHVLRKEWKKVLAIWTTLRERHRGSREWSDAGLSEAVLRSRMGKNVEANRILRDILPRTSGPQRAGVLYWLMRTGAAEAEKMSWSDSLLRAYPRSFYAAVVRDGEALALSPAEGETGNRRMSALMDYRNRRMERYDTIRGDGALALHPAFKAYESLLEAGLGEEAELTARVLVSSDVMRSFRTDMEMTTAGAQKRGVGIEVQPTTSRLLKIYAEAVRHGLDAFSLFLLTKTRPTDSSGVFPWELRYPISHVEEIRRETESVGVTPLLLLAIIREESSFDPKAVSGDGARGLMQLLPATAAWISRPADSSVVTPDDLFDPSKNIALGCRYVDYLLKRFDGSLVGALAAYNGGEGKMAVWREIFNITEDPLMAIEMIGPRETRLYVKKVLDSLCAYRAIAEEQVERR